MPLDSGMAFVLIPAGNFMMGSKLGPEEVAQKYGDNAKWSKFEHPPHKVTISKQFYLQSTTVTQGQWKKVMRDTPSKFNDCGNDCPVENVSWDMAQEFIRKLNGMEGIDKYRFPPKPSGNTRPVPAPLLSFHLEMMRDSSVNMPGLVKILTKTLIRL